MILSAKSAGRRPFNGDCGWDENMETLLKKVGAEVCNEFM
jgi:hypothetical protein